MPLAHCISELNPAFRIGNARRASEPYFVYATDFDGVFAISKIWVFIWRIKWGMRNITLEVES